MPRKAKKPRSDDLSHAIPDTDWIEQRINALGLLKTEMAPIFGVAPNKLWQMVTGRRRVQVAEIMIWSRLLQIPPRLAIEKFGTPWPDDVVPVTGEVGADGRVSPIAPGSTAPAPDSTLLELYGVRLGVDAPGAGLAAGAVLYFVKTDRIDQRAAGRLSVVGLGDAGSLPIVGVVAPAGLGRIQIAPLGGGALVYSEMPISAAPIVWTWGGT